MLSPSAVLDQGESVENQQCLESHHRTNKCRVACGVFKQNRRASVTSQDHDIKSKPFTAVDCLNFEDSCPQIGTKQDGHFLIRWEVCQKLLEVIIAVGEFAILETAKDVHSLRELIIQTNPQYIFATSLVESKVLYRFSVCGKRTDVD